MSLNHVILGLLSEEPLTGYEIKKVIQNTPFMYWSGNNNQIYKACAELLDEGFVTKEVQHQDGAPSKYIYTVTDSGLTELTNWLLTVTEVPVFRKQFLIKLAMASRLKRNDLENMLTSYENVVRMQAVLSQRELDKSYLTGKGASNQALFTDLICENVKSFYDNELAWIKRVKERIARLPDEGNPIVESKKMEEKEKVGSQMHCQIIEREGKRILHVTSSSPLLQSERDGQEILSLCAEHDTNVLLLEGDLSDEFIRLRTGLAGNVLQKFGNYQVKLALATNSGQNFPNRFQEMVSEQRTGNTFRIFASLEEATNWLLEKR